MFKFIAKKITLVPTTALTLAEESAQMWREGHAGEDNEDYWMPRYESIFAEMMNVPDEQQARKDALSEDYSWDEYEDDEEYADRLRSYHVRAEREPEDLGYPF